LICAIQAGIAETQREQIRAAAVFNLRANVSPQRDGRHCIALADFVV
jgi:hypothetical protein